MTLYNRQNLSKSKQNDMDIAQNYWKRGNTHASSIEFRENAIVDFDMHDGRQWLGSDIEKLKARGQRPLQANIIESTINSMLGAQIQTRFWNAIRNDSTNLQNDELARYLTHLLYYIQRSESMSYKGSLKYRDMMICGIGFSEIYNDNGKICYEHVHPLNVIMDPDDLSPQYTNSKFMCRKRWMSPGMVKKIWPHSGLYIDDYNAFPANYSPEILDRTSAYTDAQNFTGASDSRILVCEVQHKKPKTAYRGIDKQGLYFETFDEERAEEMADSKKDIEDFASETIVRTIFVNNTLLENSLVEPAMPGMNDFTHIPCVLNRRTSDGVPMGLVYKMRDLQRDLNSRLTRALYNANSRTLIVSGHLLNGMTPEQLEQKLKQPDIVLNLPPDVKYEMRENAAATDVQLKMIEYYQKLLQSITGVYDDFRGKETNASSAVAQRQRQINSVRNNVYSFDNFAYMKEREARFIMSMIQSSGAENILAQIFTPEERSHIVLNLAREVNGKKIIFNDIRNLPLSFYVEEVPDFGSSVEERKEALENLVANPMGPQLAQSPTLLKMLGVRDADKVSAELQKIAAMQQGMRSGGNVRNIGQQQPEPEMPAELQQMMGAA